ncbi:MAG: periplasmic protein TonB [Pseudomonadota bacterium]|nr:periplasmic protein TonB [Pseudomonadota bacterium]
MKLHRQPAGIFMAVSLAIHAAVLTVATFGESRKTENSFNSLDIELTGKIGFTPVAEALPNLPAINTRKPEPALPEPQAPAAGNIVTENAATDTSGIASGHSSQIIVQADFIRQKISGEFSRYFYYPEAARRRNWQGDVVLQFNLLPDGHLDQIRIHQSSGYTSLDEAAVHALQQVQPQLELASLTDAGILHVLPVSYRLTNPL